MAPHSEVVDSGHEKPAETQHEPSPPNKQGVSSIGGFPKPPTFDDKYKERQYQKERLALAFRIFARLGFDEGVAGHITLRVRYLSSKSS